MIRAQIILEKWQHEWLSEQSKQGSTSMSALVRDLLTEAIEHRQIESPEEEDPLWGIIGLGAGPDDGITSENLDEFLYQPDWQSRPTRKVSEDGPTDS